jgi:hypothetical protein
MPSRRFPAPWRADKIPKGADEGRGAADRHNVARLPGAAWEGKAGEKKNPLKRFDCERQLRAFVHAGWGSHRQGRRQAAPRLARPGAHRDMGAPDILKEEGYDYVEPGSPASPRTASNSLSLPSTAPGSISSRASFPNSPAPSCATSASHPSKNSRIASWPPWIISTAIPSFTPGPTSSTRPHDIYDSNFKIAGLGRARDRLNPQRRSVFSPRSRTCRRNV